MTLQSIQVALHTIKFQAGRSLGIDGLRHETIRTMEQSRYPYLLLSAMSDHGKTGPTKSIPSRSPIMVKAIIEKPMMLGFSGNPTSPDQHSEMTPYEVGCDETEAWVPTWGFGRPFHEGKSTMQLPEQSLALLLGLCTSAPAGPLTSYLGTISRNLPANFLGNSVHALANRVAKFWGKQGTEEFQEHHPLHACNEHNFLYHYTPHPPGSPTARPPGLENSPRIHLIDSGMDNNCPTYVLLHPHRAVDVIINMDASSDVQKDSFPTRVDQIGGRRGIKFTKRHDVTPAADPKDPDRFRGMYAQIYDGVPCARPETVIDSYGRTVKTPPAPAYGRECTMVYMPLLPNERAVPGYDPSTAKFSGSYNLVWTPEQVEMLVRICVANFEQGEGTVKEVMRAAWQRRKAERERGGVGGVGVKV
ncbi:hypothetical protein LTS09_002723 [Friedmanniomyces endolithicus]|nr:hypothetical protein LTS09_002723 [Friedmanniomyces endolithicus]